MTLFRSAMSDMPQDTRESALGVADVKVTVEVNGKRWGRVTGTGKAR